MSGENEAHEIPLRPAGDPDVNAAFGAERDVRLQAYGFLREQLHRDMLRDGREDDLAFHQRKLVADADAAPAAERKVSEARECGFAFGQEAVGIEAQRVFEPAGIAMHEPWGEKNEFAFVHGKAADRGI